AAGGAGAGAGLSAGAGRPADGARFRAAQPAVARRGAEALRSRRYRGGPRQPARAAPPLWRLGGDLRAGGARLAGAFLGARDQQHRDARRFGRRLACDLGGGGGVRRPRHPRSSRSGAGSRFRRGGDRRLAGAAGTLVMEAAIASARRVPRGTLVHVFWRSLFLQAAWNPRGMQNVGFADAIAPALDELYADPAERSRATQRHLEFFNCHPYLAAAILGGAVRLEERVAAGEAPPEHVSNFKAALGPPFAALGDGFFWLALRPTAALVAAAVEPFLGLGCVLVFLGLYNSVHLSTRVWLFWTGYSRAEGVVDAVGRA